MMFSTSSPTYPASVSVVASTMVKGTDSMRASVWASSVFPVPVGPAISFLTSRCDLLQKLQRRTSPLFPFFDMFPFRGVPKFFYARPGVSRKASVSEGTDRRLCVIPLLPFRNHLIHQTVVNCFMRLQDVVAIGVLVHFLHRLAGVVGKDLIHARLHAHDVFGVDIDLRGLAGQAPAHDQRLMNDHARVRQGVALPLFSGGQQ